LQLYKRPKKRASQLTILSDRITLFAFFNIISTAQSSNLETFLHLVGRPHQELSVSFPQHIKKVPLVVTPIVLSGPQKKKITPMYMLTVFTHYIIVCEEMLNRKKQCPPQ